MSKTLTRSGFPRAAILNRTVLVEAPTDARRVTGGVSQTWATVWQGHAAVKGRGARDILEGGQVSELRRAVFELRYNRLVQPGQRIKLMPDESELWNIEGIDDPDGRSIRMLLTCSRTEPAP